MNEQISNEEYHEEESLTEQKAKARRAQRIEEMKKQKARQILFQNCIKVAVPALAVILVLAILIKGRGKDTEEEVMASHATETMEETLASVVAETMEESPASTQENDSDNTTASESDAVAETEANEPVVYSASSTSHTLTLGSELVSEHAILIDLDSNHILAGKDAKTIISPASMTKVLTVLVAAEHITEAQLDDTFTMTLEVTDYAYMNDCSSVGFLDGEEVTVRDLFYGTILHSGGDAAVGLAVYVAGSHEAFVEMMNDKLEELGLSETAHVTNCVGLYDKEHYCTVYDMAMIMEAAINNDLCREVMNAHTYTTSATEQHPEGIPISNWFLRRIEDKDTGGEVLCAKTGYVVQSGNCAVSYAKDHAGKQYICVTTNATSNWKCIYDHVALYKMFATGEE